MKGSPDISIIGCGKVGCAIAQLASGSGRNLAALASRSETSARQLGELVDAPDAVCDIHRAAGAAPLVLLTVNDDAIEPLCNQLADAGAFSHRSVVAHCSGALGSDVLSAARDRCACRIASMHPLTTFPTAQAAVEKFAGTYCFCEGDSSAVEAVMELARDIGGRPMSISTQGKVLYHAAAVMACNYLTALMDASVTLCGDAGIDRQTALAAMGPLAAATLENVTKLGAADALTGPIARGDAQTVARHLEALGGCDEDLRNFYRIAGKWALQLAKVQDNHNQAGDDDIAKLLDSQD
ncbi:MAG: DUF2520 domain-containing protein [Phycisphaerae bacterium]|jgi:predicted short-subunit dehydrogenase-like oxidoreductase (DUF2520 family)|nr:DUF2520 domain-containing protein [Phycisphaerae bacterium]MDP7287092.1 DUF2520 domain-containing protein [Phycisphaerae bacterium]